MTDYEAVLGAQPAVPNGTDPLQTAGILALVPGADVLDAAACLRRLVPLMPTDALDRRVIRNRAISVLKEARIADAAGLVDAALPGSAPTTADTLQGQGVALGDPEPWPEAVAGAALLDELLATFARFAALSDGVDVLLALWTLHAHAHEAAQVSPILAITSPEKECGKTTLLTLLLGLTPRALLASNISTAGVFRTVERYRPTLLVDEADTFLRDNEELRGILNSGHFRAGAHIVRNVGEEFEPRTFSTWCPKAIALIGELPDTLTSRSVAVRMRRATAIEDARLEPLRLDRLGQLEPLRRRAWRWARDHVDALRQEDPPMPAGLRGRAADNWRPLLAIADRAGETWPARARAAVAQLAGIAAETEQAPATQLLADLRELFQQRRVDRLASIEVVAALTQREDRPWPEWKGGRPLTVRQLARLLGRFGITPVGIRLPDGSTPRGYRVDQLAEPWARYLPSDPQQPQQANSGADLSLSDDPQHDLLVADGKNSEKPHGRSPVADVADEKGGAGKEGDCHHPKVAGLCPECDRGRFLAALEAETARLAL